ncbi:Phenylacetic acid catabolic protein [Parasedimentitalea maritima]|uniref:Phenylacetic acid catabolic n=1 Tax=Parasedimentitalea maritima TaxID=2578117 RepID=A0A6A4RLW1_9RHOB|nr:Phenylacetic acid catabolic protein [Zongyanglinia marina]KAE9632727.1 phenylacetic acid catabolic [Zongyanglinia marina]
MADDMSIESYLAAGGVLTSPSNTPPRYRAELMKIMAIFVDSELAGTAGFAEMINAGPGVRDRMAAAQIVLEKTANANRVLELMGEFGANTERYVSHHPWTTRLPRDADIGQQRSDHDMRLSVFNYPLHGWADAVVMNLLMGLAAAVQLEELSHVSYQPLAEVFRTIAPIEDTHTELADKGLALLSEHDDRAALQHSVNYWWPRVAASFGDESSQKFEGLKAMGLRKTSNAAQKTRWQDEASAALKKHGLKPAQ